MKSNGEDIADLGYFSPRAVPATPYEDMVSTILDAQNKKDDDEFAKQEATFATKASIAAAKKHEWEFQDTMAVQLDVLRSADVICAQMISAGGPLLSKLGSFAAILVDEVAQSTEPGVVVPIVQRGCDRLVLVGDHCQLPPTVMSEEAQRRGLSMSLYGRLVDQGVSPYFLDTQFRSHPKLMEFVSEKIYGGRLKNGTLAEARPLVSGFQWPRQKVPVAFIEMGVKSREQIEGESKSNTHEAERVMAVLDAVLAAGELSCNDIGVITPYMGQVRLLRKLWRDRNRRSAAKGKKKRPGQGVGSRVPAIDHTSLEISSVDMFQGREKELIIFSAVRNNRGGRVGFLSDWRRLNVMLTRAKRGLIVVGAVRSLHAMLPCCYSIKPFGACSSKTPVVLLLLSS